MTQQEVGNEKVKVKITRGNGCRVTFDIEIPEKETRLAHAKAIKSVNKEVSMPGFRKGKAPEKLVLQHYSQYVDREWRNLVMDGAFQEAIRLTNIYPLHQESVESPEVKRLTNEGAEFTLRFESQPEVPEVDVKQLSVTDLTAEGVSDTQIEKAIEDLRLYHANWTEVEDRAVEEGDFVDVDIDAIESPSYNICTNERFEVTKERMPSWMRGIVVGLKNGESAEGVSQKEDNFPYNSPSGEFKPTPVRVTVKSIKQAELPEVNEELAKKAGVETPEVLRERIVDSIKRENATKVEKERHNQLRLQLLEKFPFEIPASVLESERQTRIRNRLRDLRRRLSEAEVKDQSAKIEQEALHDAEAFLRLYYLLRPLVQKHNLAVTQYDMYEELTRQLHHTAADEQVLEQNMEPDLARGKLLALITTRKAMDFIIQQLSTGQAKE